MSKKTLTHEQAETIIERATDAINANPPTLAEIQGMITDEEQAVPTNRCLPPPYADGEEWVEYGHIADMNAATYYLFGAADIAEATARCETNPPECYPWDADHILRVECDGADIWTDGSVGIA